MGEYEIVCNSFSGAKHLYDLCDISAGSDKISVFRTCVCRVMYLGTLSSIYCHLNNIKTKKL